MVKQAEKAFAARTIDNSPQLDAALFRDLLEQVSALNLGNLAHEFTASCSEFPLLYEATYQRPLDQTREGYLMATAFETGRRYNMLQVFALLSEEVQALPDEPVETTKGVVLEN
jgi:alpha-D-ribose 1-methylphosphonate 5-triphosphate synthase subunit PhnI